MTFRPGCPIRTPTDHSLVTSSPWLFAGSRVLRRLLTPRHPPCALGRLITSTEGRREPHGPKPDCFPPTPRWMCQSPHDTLHPRPLGFRGSGVLCRRPPREKRDAEPHACVQIRCSRPWPWPNERHALDIAHTSIDRTSTEHGHGNRIRYPVAKDDRVTGHARWPVHPGGRATGFRPFRSGSASIGIAQLLSSRGEDLL